MKKRTKMEDIARLAGVSKSTVSRALQDSDQVSQATKSRIRRLAYAHNYRMTSSAWEWREDRRPNVTVVLPTGRAQSEPFSSPFAMEMVGHIADQLMDRGYNTLLTKYPLWKDDVIPALQSAGPSEGLIMIGQRRYQHVVKKVAREIPNMVVWGGILNDLNYCAVGTDNRKGGELATSHLIRLGRKRIAFFGDIDAVEPRLRYQGYRDALAKHGADFDEALLVRTPYDLVSAYTEINARINSQLNFDAVFAANDVMAMNVVRGLNDAGVSVPDDVAVIGYDDVSAAEYFTPPLTTVRQSIEQGSAILVDSLLKIVAGEYAQSTLLPSELVVRRSCGANTDRAR